MPENNEEKDSNKGQVELSEFSKKILEAANRGVAEAVQNLRDKGLPIYGLDMDGNLVTEHEGKVTITMKQEMKMEQPTCIKHVSYPSIGQFRNTIRAVVSQARFVGVDENGDAIINPLVPLPVLTYRGTVKLHGTNAAIGRRLVMDPSIDEIWFQSRERIITPAKDNMGFASKYYGQPLEKLLFDKLPEGEEVIVFGEWCGQGIQSTVGIGRLPKMFVVFDVRIDGVWQSKEVVQSVGCKELNIFNIYDYHTEEVDIDFAFPENIQNKLVDLTTKVADRCPVAHAFGVEGIGEGIVWRCISDSKYADPGFMFKVKDERHATGAGKVKVLAEVDAQAVADIKEFAELVVTESRCRQGIDKMRERGLELDRSCIGHFINWVFDDVVKEELDVAIKSKIDLGKAKGAVTKLARDWFFTHESEF